MIEALIESAREHIERGLPIIPVDGKKPLGGKGWQNRTFSVDEIADLLRGKAAPGIGLKLGPASCIDIECDSEADKQAFKELFDGCEVPITPTYNSSRGKHRLFAWSDTLANTSAAVVHFRTLGIRIGADGKGAQSVIPPSGEREWLPGLSPDDVGFAELSETVITRIVAAAHGGVVDGKAKRGADHWQRCAGGVAEGQGRNENLASVVGKLIEGKPIDSESDVQFIKSIAAAVNSQNKPPLSPPEFEATFASIIKRERQGRAAAELAAELSKESADGAPAGWSLVIVHGNPPYYLMASPLFDGQVKLDCDPYDTARYVRRKIRADKGVFIERSKFDRRWEGDARRGIASLAKQLFDSAEHRAATAEERRELVVLEALLDYVDKAKVSGESQEPDPRGAPVRMSDGSVWFKMKAAYEEIGYGLTKIKFGEFVECVKESRATDEQGGPKESRRRYKVLSKPSILAMRARLIEARKVSAEPTPI